MRRFLPLSLFFLLAACFCSSPPAVMRLSGKTMGTTYNVVIVGSPVAQEKLETSIADALREVNGKMSNWDPESEISKFNASQSTDPQGISPQMGHVMLAAARVHDLSEGKFDVTLAPLIDLWGFGPRKPGDAVPSDSEILAALAQVGQTTRLTLSGDGRTLTKAAADVQINLSAIAKGYGVDAVAQALEAHEISNYMVEIGGDLVASGTNPEGNSWQIGVERPGIVAKSLELVISVENKGVATSGDYRNYREHEGKRYSHILDPTTGRPITHKTASATVIAENAMMADAWATAMLALGEERGLQIAEANDLAVYFITRDESGSETTFTTAQSAAFTALTKRK